ncbi:MAG: response regulator transcription factor [Ignavibacteriaceae bacterium]|nr:response regulator transcription factor [Ignavibacteriaceae bacterium]
MNKIRIIIADDHTILRQGLVDILDKFEDICVVAEAEDGNSLVSKYFTIHPDLVLSDIEMPNQNGLDAAREILSRDPEAKILFLSMYNSDEDFFKILQTKAYGLVSKEIIKSELVLAIRTVFNGEKYFLGKSSEDIKAIIAKYSLADPDESNNAEARSITLTPTEKNVLMMIADGKTSQEIANISHKSKRTVDSIRSTIMSKLNLHSAPQLIKYAVELSFLAQHKQKSKS